MKDSRYSGMRRSFGRPRHVLVAVVVATVMGVVGGVSPLSAQAATLGGAASATSAASSRTTSRVAIVPLGNRITATARSYYALQLAWNGSTTTVRPVIVLRGKVRAIPGATLGYGSKTWFRSLGASLSIDRAVSASPGDRQLYVRIVNKSGTTFTPYGAQFRIEGKSVYRINLQRNTTTGGGMGNITSYTYARGVKTLDWEESISE